MRHIPDTDKTMTTRSRKGFSWLSGLFFHLRVGSSIPFDATGQSSLALAGILFAKQITGGFPARARKAVLVQEGAHGSLQAVCCWVPGSCCLGADEAGDNAEGTR